MKKKFIQFMHGRYGVDNLYNFLCSAFVIMWLLNLLLNNRIIYYFNYIILLYALYRILSKNISKRRKENNFYLKIKNKIIKETKFIKERWTRRKTKVYRKCPNCKIMVRLPRKKGKNTCICPKCRKKFVVKCH